MLAAHWRQLDFNQAAFAVAAVAVAVIEDIAQNPLLLPNIPIGPGIPTDLVGATRPADYCYPLAVVFH